MQVVKVEEAVRTGFQTLLRVAVCALAIGCGGSADEEFTTGTVSGKVTYNGQPLTKGAVQFYSPELSFGASAPIGSDGAYVVTDPLRAGTYKVTISSHAPGDVPTIDPALSAEDPSAANPKSVDAPPYPKKYLNQEETPLTVEIKEGANTADLALTD